MASKLTGWCGKLFAVVFTSIVAPVVVNLAVREAPDEGSRPARDEQVAFRQLETSPPICPAVPAPPLSPTPQPLLPQCPDASAAASRPMQAVRVIAAGVGRTPEAALQDALHTALRQALASVVDAETWARNGSALCAGVLRDSSGIILGWKDLGARKEWGLRGLLYHKEAAVEVNLSALADRLRADHTTGWSNPTQATQVQRSFPLPQIQ